MNTHADKPLHERVGILGRIRRRFRGAVLDVIRKALNTDDGRTAARRALLDAPVRTGGLGLAEHQRKPTDYADLAAPPPDGRACMRRDVVLITARFRSGSTLLWNLFRNLDGCTAYYEPFNERRWFDPATRGARTDPTHQHVTDYWREYEGLEELGGIHDPAWHERNLFLPAGAWAPDMKRFLEVLIERAPSRPVLQFNRMDFRLPWLRREFPNAALVHIVRHPRDQWCSTLVDPSTYRRDDSAAAFREHDHFYLRLWARDLKHHFPFLDESRTQHPYQLFYYLWKLSYLFGRRYATHFVSFEDLVGDPSSTVAGLLDGLGISAADAGDVAGLVEPSRPGRWREWADAEWFGKHEEVCERVLSEFLADG